MGKQAKRISISDIISAFALFISVVALIITALEGEAARRHNRLSMTPIIQFERIFVPHEPRPQLGIYMANHGTGVALLESFTVYVDGKPTPLSDYGGLGEAARMLGLLDRSDFPVKFVTNLRKAVAPGEVLFLFGFDKEDYTKERGALLRDAMSRISIHVKYKSVYDDVYEQDLERPQ